MPVSSWGRTDPVRPVLRDPRFAFLLAGQSVNAIGSWASAIVVWGFAAYRFGASPAALSLTVVCWSLPPAALSPLTGALADRFGPRPLLIAGYLGAAATALAMAAAPSLAFLDVTAAAYGAARALSGPAGSALTPRVVEPGDLLQANALLGVTSAVGQVAGPLTASALLALAGFRAAFIADAATYLIGVIVLVPLPVRPVPPPEQPPEPGPRRGVLGAVRATLHDPALRVILLARLGVIVTSGAFLVVEPLYARQVLGRPPSQFALFEAAIGAGAIVTGLLLPPLRRRASRAPAGPRAVAAAAAGYGLAAALFAGTPWVAVAYAGAFAWGSSGAVFYTLAVTATQRLARPGTLGTTLGVFTTAESAAETASMPLAGALVTATGTRLGALVIAAVAVASGAGAVTSGARPPDEQTGGQQ